MRNGTSNQFDGARVTVMGLGRFGGGLGVTRWLCHQGARVLLTDLAGADDLAEPLALLAPEFESGSLTLRLGEHREDDFRGADVVIANPAVKRPAENPMLSAAWEAGVTVTSEIALSIRSLPSRDQILGVTGTVAKSTTCAMTHAALITAGRTAVLGGNFGGSLLAIADHIIPATLVTLELSSSQLWWIDRDPTLAGWSPRVAVITSFSPNHLDWHASLDEYHRSKKRLLMHQQTGDTAIFGPSLAEASTSWPTPSGVSRIQISASDIPPASVCPPDLAPTVMRINAAVALRAASALAGEPLDINHLNEFRPLPHRLRFVREHRGVRYFNDSKSTTPDSSSAAASAFEPGTVHLIAGGADKGSPIEALLDGLPRLAGLYTIGATGEAIASRARGQDRFRLVTHCATLEAAIAESSKFASAGDVVLLSPGHASWDQFPNYEHRGESFERLARDLA